MGAGASRSAGVVDASIRAEGPKPPTENELAPFTGRPGHRIVGLLMRRIGQTGPALEIADAIVAAARRNGDLALLESTLNDLALTQRERGDRVGALETLQQEEALCRRRVDARALRICQGNQAVVLKELGATDAAMQLFNAPIDASREPLDEAALASALTNRAELLARDRPQDALQALREAEHLFRAIGDRDGLAAALGNLGVWRPTRTTSHSDPRPSTPKRRLFTRHWVTGPASHGRVPDRPRWHCGGRTSTGRCASPGGPGLWPLRALRR